MPAGDNAPLTLFYSYSSKDIKLRERLEVHLKHLERQQLLAGWHDRMIAAGTEWEPQIHEQLQSADIILALLSEDFLASNYCYDIELEKARERHDKNEARLIPVILRNCGWRDAPLLSDLQALPQDARPINQWKPHNEGFHSVYQGLRQVIAEMQRETPSSVPGIAGEEREDVRPTTCDPPADSILLNQEAARLVTPSSEGAIMPTSPFFIQRACLTTIVRALESTAPTVTFKGHRQSGKSTLLAFLHKHALQAGQLSCCLDLQVLDEVSLSAPTPLFKALAQMIADELELDIDPDGLWRENGQAKANFTRFIERGVLAGTDAPVQLLLDEVDVVFSNPKCRKSLFSTLRHWHNRRAPDTKNRWPRLRMVIAHATDPVLWITDLNQSPFNVGLQMEVNEFTAAEVAELNDKHAEVIGVAPLKSANEIEELMKTVGGHPYLIRLALYQLATGGSMLHDLAASALDDHGPFAAHLRRLGQLIGQHPELIDALRQIVASASCHDEHQFQQLWSVGLVSGTIDNANFRCNVYKEYIRAKLGI